MCQRLTTLEVMIRAMPSSIGNLQRKVNKNSALRATDPLFLEVDSNLIMVWAEDRTPYQAGNGDMGRTSQIRVAHYGGNDNSPDWAFIEEASSAGINKDSSKHAEYPQACVLNAKTYVIWGESNSSEILQIRVKSRSL